MFSSFSEDTLSRASQVLDARERNSYINQPALPIDDPKSREARCFATLKRSADKAAFKLFKAEADRFDKLWALVKLIRRPAEARDAYVKLVAEGVQLDPTLEEQWVFENRDDARDKAQDALWKALCHDAAKRTEGEYRRGIDRTIAEVQADFDKLTEAIHSAGQKYGISVRVEDTVVHGEIQFVLGYLKSQAKRNWERVIAGCSLGLRHELQRYCEATL